MFDRLIGMETEYALRFHPASPDGDRTPNSVLFQGLLEHLKTKVPLAPSLTGEAFGPHTWFLANGAAVRFERILYFGFLPQVGLVEGMTPECRGPRQLLLCQRAQDVLLSQAAANAATSGAATLIKNNCDPFGNCYGNHENYEATVASGAMLLFWRLGIVVLTPVLFVLAFVIDLLVLATIGLLYAATSLVCRAFRIRTRPLRVWEVGAPLLLDWILLPVRLIAGTFFELTAFRPQRERLLAFLVSRPIVTGSGALDGHGRFHLSARARMIQHECGVVRKRSRPIFLFNHMLNNVLRPLLGDRFSYATLFRARQRLQISVGDSNMTQVAEYLKIGTTLLVLDAIEAGDLENAPRLKRPVRALHAICADPNLRTAVPLTHGERWTALQIQRFYLDACRRYVNRTTSTAPASAAPASRAPAAAVPEARAILQVWQETLDALERDPTELVGKLDWVTKRYLLEQAGGDAPLDARRKIDVRYHELSRDGYYLQLEAAGLAPTIVEPEEVLLAAVTPPLETPAAERGNLIRAHAASGKPVRTSWSAAIVGSGQQSHIVRFR